MTQTNITKIEAARRQIDTAIELMFLGYDPIPIHTIIAAASRIVRDLSEQANTLGWQKLMEAITPGSERVVLGGFNKYSNFFKHADTDPNAVINEISETLNENILIITTGLYRYLSSMTSYMIAYEAWHMHFYPEQWDIDRMMKEDPKLASIAFCNPEEIANISRSQKLQDGILRLRLADKLSQFSQVPSQTRRPSGPCLPSGR